MFMRSVGVLSCLAYTVKNDRDFNGKNCENVTVKTCLV